MSFPYPIGQPPLDNPEPVDSPFYGDIGLPFIPAINFQDGKNGRYCSRSQVWVPASRLKWCMGLPYLDVLCPTEPEAPPDLPVGLTS